MLGAPRLFMRPIDHTLKSHDAKKHAPYSFRGDTYTTWKVQVPEGHVAHVEHADGRVTQHDEDVETPIGARLIKLEKMDER